MSSVGGLYCSHAPNGPAHKMGIPLLGTNMPRVSGLNRSSMPFGAGCTFSSETGHISSIHPPPPGRRPLPGSSGANVKPRSGWAKYL